MGEKLTQRYNEVKAEYEEIQKKLAALQAEQAERESKLMRVNIGLQVQGRGITHTAPVGFTTGNTE